MKKRLTRRIIMKKLGLIVGAAILLVIVFIGWWASSLPEHGTTGTVSADILWLGPSDIIVVDGFGDPKAQGDAGPSYRACTGNMQFESPIIISAPSPSDLKDEGVCLEYGVSEQNVAQNEDTAQSRAIHPDPPFHGSIMQAAKAYQVDAALIRAIIMAESNNIPKAVSNCGARGLMQLMPATAQWLGVLDSFDPAGNIDGGVRYFKILLDRFDGNVQLALAAYNAGSRYVLKYGGVPPFSATRVYIKKVLNYHRQYQAEIAVNENELNTN
jgi:hypothetical protein